MIKYQLWFEKGVRKFWENLLLFWVEAMLYHHAFLIMIIVWITFHETSQNYKMLPSRTLARKAVTVLTCANASGSFQLPLLVIEKLWKHCAVLQDGNGKNPWSYLVKTNRTSPMGFLKTMLSHIQLFLCKSGLRCSIHRIRILSIL